MDESKAHDQETQTNFDVNPRERREPSLHGTPSLDRRYRYNQRHSQPWPAAGHPYYRNPYPDYYPYDMPYPPPPPPPSLPAALHGSSHYYPGRTPHWHNPPSPVPPHLSQIPRAHSTFPHYLYNHMDGYYPHHPPTRGVAPASAISHRRHSEIARPKAEWPPGYQPHVKPNVPSDYLATFCGNVGSEYGGPPSTATSLKSTVIDLPHSNFSSPRPSARISRKRALSNTPSSVESIDLNALIRGSPDSLLGYLGPARVSSAGSFGHLSPIGFCTSPVSRQAPHYPTVRNLFITPPPIPPLRLPTPSSTRDTVPSSTTGAEGIKEEVKEEPMSHSQSPPASSIKEPEGSHSRDESMEVCHLDSTTSPGTSEVKAGSDNEAEEGHAEQEEQDLNCHWKECPTQFESQEALVNHVNSDHIKRERKDFTCYWDGCNREKKPFKAQYMLVVHMRRHTGEKPHKCTYEGCIKAYSRLENLKTHLRSHTGERPYVCEVEGCNKAFSNASDRAKHQNRTHSSVKPYVCKVPGCPKRYTDPSSLRKHTKTVHGEQGIKRLKAEGSREKPPSNPDKKGSSTPEKGPTPQDSNSAAQSTSYAVSTQLQEPKSPATNGSSVVGGSCSQTFAGSCCEGDTISSSCDRTPGGLDIPSSQDSPHSIGNSTLGVSPRSPPFVNHLPDILEGDWEPAESGAMTTVQSIVNMPQPQSVTLPKIDNHKRDVAQWVNDVHRRMSETSRRSSEGSHLSVEMAADMSRRSSQESGWSSYNGSRRSSQASPFPTTSLQRSPQEMTSRPLNAPVVPQLVVVPQCRPYLHPLDGSEDFFRRQSETSTCSNLSAPYNRLSRNSSGYGSQSNLAVIRSPMFHKIPPSSHFSPQRSICADAVNRRKSDTIVCEADSSGRYLPKNGKGELRRSSEPVGQVRGLARLEPSSGNVNREVTPMENLNETELISDDFDPNELDAYLSPQREGQMDSNSSGNQVVPAPVPRQTQRLCHYPYPEDQQSYPQQPPSQTVHHRPHPGYHSQADHGQQTCEEQVLRGNPVASLNDAEVPRMIPEGYWPQHGFRTEQQSAFYQQGCPTSENGVYNTAMHPPGQKGCTDMGNYEDAMVTGIGLLSTNSNGGVSEFVGNGNMVVNDMNTLLTSLLEEEKYLELRQNSRGVAGSAMSIF